MSFFTSSFSDGKTSFFTKSTPSEKVLLEEEDNNRRSEFPPEATENIDKENVILSQNNDITDIESKKSPTKRSGDSDVQYTSEVAAIATDVDQRATKRVRFEDSISDKDVESSNYAHVDSVTENNDRGGKTSANAQPQKQFFSVPKISIAPRKQTVVTSTETHIEDTSDIVRADVSSVNKPICKQAVPCTRSNEGDVAPAVTTPSVDWPPERKPQLIRKHAEGLTFRLQSNMRNSSTETIQRQIECIAKIIDRGQLDIQKTKEILQNQNIEISELLARLCIDDNIGELGENMNFIEDTLSRVNNNLNRLMTTLHID